MNDVYTDLEIANGDHLEHHGILGMKWGVRRYQNPDGSLTAAGRRRYTSQPLVNRAKRISSKRDQAYKLTTKYKQAMDKKADKRAEQAEGKKNSIAANRALGAARRAAEERDRAYNISSKYETAMDRKVKKRKEVALSEQEKRIQEASDRLDRAKYERESAENLSNRYLQAMDKKADKRAKQAEGKKETSITADKARRAAEENEKAKKLVDKYLSAFDKKVNDRQDLVNLEKAGYNFIDEYIKEK